jgi:hypothetical protein
MCLYIKYNIQAVSKFKVIQTINCLYIEDKHFLTASIFLIYLKNNFIGRNSISLSIGFCYGNILTKSNGSTNIMILDPSELMFFFLRNEI